MPHFGLIDESLSFTDQLLQRARLHFRCGKRKLKQGKPREGIATLYDAVIAGMQWYFSSPERKASLNLSTNDDLHDDLILFSVLKRSNILNKDLDFQSFSDLAEKALDDELEAFNSNDIIEMAVSTLRQLDVLPFEEKSLPSENSSSI